MVKELLKWAQNFTFKWAKVLVVILTITAVASFFGFTKVINTIVINANNQASDKNTTGKETKSDEDNWSWRSWK